MNENLDDNVMKYLKEKISHWDEGDDAGKNIEDIIAVVQIICGTKTYSQTGGLYFEPFFTLKDLVALDLRGVYQKYHLEDAMYEIFVRDLHVFSKSVPLEKIKDAVAKSYTPYTDEKKVTKDMVIEAGRRFGYPECCIQHAVNKKNFFDGYEFPFTSHGACSRDCEESRMINHKVRALLIELGRNDLLDYREKEVKIFTPQKRYHDILCALDKKKQEIKNREE
ncbi:MAG: hypothetical protein KJ886_02705 [Candidatus Thermoplasmatota archaeon]|nr:hypothetical protein [Candidatus Thermoplasmatota archaeon]MBU4256544.1 hypothetical protein [Candidatus Thermoplasmatota archaeon]